MNTATSMEQEEASPIQKTAIFGGGKVFEIPSDCYVRIERFSLVDDQPGENGKRLVIMANTTALSKSQKQITADIAISSFIIGEDYEQSAELLFSPSEHCTIRTIGPNISVQILYSEFPQ